MNNEHVRDQILAVLSEEPMKFSELADLIGGDPSFLSNLVSQMRKQKEIDMRPDRTLEVGRIVPSMFTTVSGQNDHLPKGVTPIQDDPAPETQVPTSLRRTIVEKLAESDVKLTVNQLAEKIFGKAIDATKIRTELKIMAEEEVVERDGSGYYTLSSNPKPHPAKFQAVAQRAQAIRSNQLYEGKKHTPSEPHTERKDTKSETHYKKTKTKSEPHTERKDTKSEPLKERKVHENEIHIENKCVENERLEKISIELDRVRRSLRGEVENKDVKIMVLKALAEVVPQETRNVINSIIDDIS